MNDLITINYESDNPTVSGRELHAALEVQTAYKDWFPRMCEYGFSEGTDFSSILSESTGGTRIEDSAKNVWYVTESYDEVKHLIEAAAD